MSTSRIRFYEAEGLLNTVYRKPNGYREYPADALTTLGVIVGAQRAGFALDEIRKLLPAKLGNWRRSELIGALRRKIADIEQMEKQLSRNKRQLCALIRRIEAQPGGAGCAEETERLLKEFVTRSIPATNSKQKGRSTGSAPLTS